VGSPETVRRALQAFVERTGADELMVSAAVYDQPARLRSYELLAEVGRALQPSHSALLATA
jgi:alkanesulfonate monooxygenase SsuD/methylene tetrahydromethanopterin reductase-like flavin-dependent oxidoreductase (luciferase family)